jgi:hypothetical protein
MCMSEVSDFRWMVLALTNPLRCIAMALIVGDQSSVWTVDCNVHDSDGIGVGFGALGFGAFANLE